MRSARSSSGDFARQTLLTTEVLAGQHDAADLDGEADRLGQQLDARVTLIAADGRVLGDSGVDGTALATLENHLDSTRSATGEHGAGRCRRAIQHHARN